jgi:hypothetical protein
MVLEQLRIMAENIERVLAGLAVMVALGGFSSEVSGIQLIEPKAGAMAKPGEGMKVKVNIPPGMPVERVVYTLLEQDRALEDKVEYLPTVTAESSPFEAEMPIPVELAGGVRLLAVGQVAERRGQYVLFDEVIFKVEPEAGLIALQAEAPVRFTKTLGEVHLLSIRGKYQDRTIRDLTSGHSGTTYQTSNEKVVRINFDGLAQAVGNGKAEITVRNRNHDVKIPVVVEAMNTENRPPVAHAGDDQIVKQGARVRLDAILSADPEGKNPAYYWSQVAGMPINLVEPLSLRPYFFAPVVISPRVLRFRLIVKDEEGAESFPAYVNVTVIP